ncbi:MAG: branched-chain amino acid ABC transporter permease [Burkholderiaceae bacterium]
MTQTIRAVAPIAAFAIAVALAPLFVGSDAWLNFIVLALFGALMAQAWNVLAGFGGQFSFGHAVFFGTGAYAMAALQVRLGVNAWAALPVAVAAGAAVGVFIGALTFRYGLRGSYFALATLAFAEIFRILANTFQFTGAGAGLQIPLTRSPATLQFDARAGYLYVVLAFVVAALALATWLKHSRFGAWLQAVRDNEEAAQALGVDAYRVKLGAIAISGAMMAAAGAFYVQYLHYIDPALAYGPHYSVEALVGALVGGIGTVWGPVVGAFALHLLSDATRNALGDVPGVSLMIYGALLVLIVMFAPRGLVGVFAALAARLRGPR